MYEKIDINKHIKQFDLLSEEDIKSLKLFFQRTEIKDALHKINKNRKLYLYILGITSFIYIGSILSMIILAILFQELMYIFVIFFILIGVIGIDINYLLNEKYKQNIHLYLLSKINFNNIDHLEYSKNGDLFHKDIENISNQLGILPDDILPRHHTIKHIHSFSAHNNTNSFDIKSTYFKYKRVYSQNIMSYRYMLYFKYENQIINIKYPILINPYEIKGFHKKVNSKDECKKFNNLNIYSQEIENIQSILGQKNIEKISSYINKYRELSPQGKIRNIKANNLKEKIYKYFMLIVDYLKKALVSSYNTPKNRKYSISIGEKEVYVSLNVDYNTFGYFNYLEPFDKNIDNFILYYLELKHLFNFPDLTIKKED